MKYRVMMAFITVAVVYKTYCTKGETVLFPAQEQYPDSGIRKDAQSTVLQGGDEDDDGPIVMHRIANKEGGSSQQASDSESDLLGCSVFQLKLTHTGYGEVSMLIDLSEAFSFRTRAPDQL